MLDGAELQKLSSFMAHKVKSNHFQNPKYDAHSLPRRTPPPPLLPPASPLCISAASQMHFYSARRYLPLQTNSPHALMGNKNHALAGFGSHFRLLHHPLRFLSRSSRDSSPSGSASATGVLPGALAIAPDMSIPISARTWPTTSSIAWSSSSSSKTPSMASAVVQEAVSDTMSRPRGAAISSSFCSHESMCESQASDTTRGASRTHEDRC